MPLAFEGLRPASGRGHVAWVVQAMAGREGVDLVVPDGFDAYVRIHHRIHNGQRWADFAPEYLARSVEKHDYTGSRLKFIDGDGNLDAEAVDELALLLAATTATPNECHYALWQGWGWVHPGSIAVFSSGQGSGGARAIERTFNEEMAPVWTFAAACPVEPWWGGRDMILFDGALDAVSTIGHRTSSETRLERQCPQWWWPEDRTRFVGTEIDDAWTYVAGDEPLIDEILTSPQWESVRVKPPTAGRRPRGQLPIRRSRTPPTGVYPRRSMTSGQNDVVMSASTIKTVRLVLTPLVASDAEVMVDVLADERMHEFTGGHPLPLEDLRLRYQRLESGRSPDSDEVWMNWIVRLSDRLQPVGVMQATVASDRSSADVAWEIGVAAQGRGLASEGASAVVQWLIEHGVSKVRAFIHPEHAASAIVASRAGLRPSDEWVDGEIVWRRTAR